MKKTAFALVLYFMIFLALWLTCLFQPSMCSSIKALGLGGAGLGFLILALLMYMKQVEGGWMLLLLFFLLLQAALWGMCFSMCTNKATDTVKWAGVGSSILSVAIAVVAYAKSGPANGSARKNIELQARQAAHHERANKHAVLALHHAKKADEAAALANA
uniref:Uncharacterized protein n=1 Tax=Marseillevirus LCMAC103 TaxID=2506604 RepID=A0A481YVG9_9VIRU|nr:MAG: hypothetical protein LCMAC103_02350 [Marseillevirus LCMAC103]